MPQLPVVVIGAEQVIPQPEIIKQKAGSRGVLFSLAKAAITPRKPTLCVEFLPLYIDHLSQKPGDPELPIGKRAALHTQEIVTQIIIPRILELDPSYPLGYYRDLVSTMLGHSLS